jgi:hypothetical protein
MASLNCQWPDVGNRVAFLINDLGYFPAYVWTRLVLVLGLTYNGGFPQREADTSRRFFQK